MTQPVNPRIRDAPRPGHHTRRFGRFRRARWPQKREKKSFHMHNGHTKNRRPWDTSNHGATSTSSAMATFLVVNYSLLIMGDSNSDEDDGGVDGDDSGGNSPSRRRAGTETSVPRNGVLRWRRRPWSLSGVLSIRLGFLGHERLYRRRGSARGCLGGPPHRVARPPPRPRPSVVWGPWASSPAPLQCSGPSR